MNHTDNLTATILSETSQHRLFSGDCALHAIQSGAVNKSFRLTTSDTPYFVKVFTSDPVAQIDRQAQFRQQQRLAELGLAPKPVYLSADQTFQVDHWVSAQSLASSRLPSKAKYQQLATTLIKIHHIENDPQLAFQILELPKKWQFYLSISDVQLTSPELTQMGRMTDFWHSELAECSTVVHNDLSFEHTTENPSTLVFDWEYSAFSSPYYDLASCIEVNKANSFEEHILLTMYAELSGQGYNQLKNSVINMKPLVAFTNKLWFAAAHKAC